MILLYTLLPSLLHQNVADNLQISNPLIMLIYVNMYSESLTHCN